MSIFTKLFKSIKKIQPLKLIGKVANKVLAVAPTVVGAAETYQAGEAGYETRRGLGQSKSEASIGGLQDILNLRSAETTMQQNLPLLLIAGVVVVVLLMRRR